MNVAGPAHTAPSRRRSGHSWLWEETPLAWVLGVWAMAGVSLIGLFTDWFMYTGSIVFSAGPQRPVPAAHA